MDSTNLGPTRINSAMPIANSMTPVPANNKDALSSKLETPIDNSELDSNINPGATP